ncbi:hypothetical protein H310_02352 [Aphanomyces invadans]|uniref:WW domain-containing protein n=1 Tax=Aphanomyces invadans TaxID=157072 RepID=A0A024UNG6_9STRA|nr:hypothetical protein H310_02352 [Aphanomyces invadans]ETW07966.1 hypothetical protein H310_02352 [Aphanomyces invadans]|eukprot:XP_008864059.1 hypothetical protein H310_02352 [Aphanomyces invadans]
MAGPHRPSKPSPLSNLLTPQEINQFHDDESEPRDIVQLESLSSRSERDLDAKPTVFSPPTSLSPTSLLSCTLTPAVLHHRYPRFCQTMVAARQFRSRPIAWVLKVVEEICDGYYAFYMESHRAPPLPLFVRTHFQRTLGLVALADQESLDLVYNLELHRETFPHLGVFVSLMRELEDEEGALFYTHCRNVVQSTFGLSLKTKEKLLAQDCARKFHSTGAIVLADHPRLQDGTQSVHLSQSACSLLVLRAIGVSKVLANHLAVVMLAPYMKAVTVDAAGRLLDQHLLSLDDVLSRLLQIFRSLPEDIVHKYKYNDDGESLTLLTRLQDTIRHDDEKVKLKAALDDHVRTERSLQIEIMKIDRLDPATRPPDVRTKLFLLKNQLQTAQRHIKGLKEQLQGTDAQINEVWSSVLRDASKVPTTQLLPLDNILARVCEFVAACHHDLLLETKLKKVLQAKRRNASDASWASQLEALQERCVIKIQRVFRQRRAWHRERRAAQADLESRRQQKLKRKAEKELERKRLEALRDRDAQRHLGRMQEKQKRDMEVQAKLKKQEDAVLKKAASAEAERRGMLANERLVARVFKRWEKFRDVSKRVKYAQKLTLMGLFGRWKAAVQISHVEMNAATTIQSAFRGMRGRREARGMKRARDKKNQLAARNVNRLLNRRLFKVWAAWTSFVEQQLTIKHRFANCMARYLQETFLQWTRLLPRRRAAALTIQTNYRGHLGRNRARRRRQEHSAATCIQRIARGRQGRKVAQMKRQLRAHQSQGTNSLLRRMLLRTLSHAFDGFKTQWELERQIRAMAAARVHRRRTWCFYILHAYRVARHRKQAERFRRQFEAATVIQRYFRGYWCRQAFRIFVRRHRSAVAIQRTYRRYRQKWIVYEMQKQTQAATRIQCRFRRNKAVAVVTRMRNEFLWQAARRGDYHVVLRSFNNGTAWNSFDEDGNSLLHLACLAGSKRLIKLCLRYGMDINAVNMTGALTPLHTIIATTYSQRAELVDYMIDHGAWHECRDGRGLTPLLLASSLGHADCIRALLARAADREALTTAQQDAIGLATSLNQIEAVAALLEAGFNPNTIIDPADGATLLHECAAHGYVEIARMLIARQAYVDAQDVDGNTPAIYAVFNQHSNVLTEILAAGAAPDIVNVATRSAMHWAIGHAEAIRLLAEADGDVNLRTKDSDTPLHLACASDDNIESTRVLLAYGASVDSKNSRGNQPAHVAARAGAAATMDLLIQYSTNMNARNFNNKNPLGEARMFNRMAVVAVIQRHYADDLKMLEDAGMDADLVDETGVVLPTKSHEDWQATLASSIRLSQLNEWTQCVDPTTDWLFYHDVASNVCTWRAPIEYQAALGQHWRVEQQKNLDVDETTNDTPAVELGTGGGESAPAKNEQEFKSTPKVYVYIHDQTGEVRTTVPPVDPDKLQALIQGMDQYKMLRSRIHKVSSETVASVAKYRAFWSDFTKDAQTLRLETQAAIKIQTRFRAYFYHKRFVELKLQHKMAIHLQRAYRGKLARRTAAHERHRHRCATKIEALVRGFLVRCREANGNNAWRVQYRLERRAVVNIQRCWRGMHGRFRAKKLQAMKRGPQTYFEWADARKHAIILQTFQVWQEMQLANSSTHGIFYCNHITGQCVWDKPIAWVENDRAKFLERQQMHYFGYTTQMLHAAITLQSMFRMRTARVYFHRLMQGVSICRSCEADYLNDPLNLTRLGNYVLYLHAIRHDYDRARPLYSRLMEYMTARGPDVPFILRCYALFLYVTEEEDVDNIAMLFERADAIDKPKKKFQLAFLGFFRYSQIMFPTNAQSNLNYAACVQWVYDQANPAKEHYLRALEADPYNKRILRLFNIFLARTNDAEGDDGADHFMRYQAAMVQTEDAARRKEYTDMAAHEERHRAAVLLQTRFRARHERKRVMRMRSVLPVPHKASSPEELQLHQAFDIVAAKNKNPSILRVDQLADVYPLVGWSVQDAADDIAYATSHMEFQYPQSITWTRFIKWIQQASPPSQWETCGTDDANVYYYNIVSGVTQWEKPRIQRPVLAPLVDTWESAYTDQGDIYYYNAFTGESRWDNPQATPSHDAVTPGWEEIVDDHGQRYYYNPSTGESAWEVPKSTTPGDEDQWEDATDGTTPYVVHKITGESLWTRPHDGWRAAVNAEGTVYYYSVQRNTSQWTSPWTTRGDTTLASPAAGDIDTNDSA